MAHPSTYRPRPGEIPTDPGVYRFRDKDGRVIYVGTFSKVLFPALRLGYLVLPPPLAPLFTAAKWLTDRHTSTLEQAVLTA